MTAEIFNAFAALVFVLGLLGLFAWGVRRFGFIPGQPAANRKTKELEIIETKMVDARNKLLVARWRGTDYLLASGPDGIKRIDEKEASTNVSTTSKYFQSDSDQDTSNER